MSLSRKLPWELANPLWAAELNPVLANPATNPTILKSVVLSTGTNVINHLLGRTQQGWFLVDRQGTGDIYRNGPFNNLTLSLHSSASVTVNIAVF